MNPVPTPKPAAPVVRWRWHALALLVLFSVSILIKWTVWQQTPQIFNDTPSYFVPALSLLNGRGYGVQEDGFRTPTFPLYLTLVLAPLDHTHFNRCTDAHRAVCIGQAAEQPDGKFIMRGLVAANILFGFGIVLLLYILGWQLTGNLVVAFLFGAGYAWNVTGAYWEISLLTEALTGFLLLLALYLTWRARPGSRTGLALGITLAILALCHQLFLLYWVLPAVFLVARFWREPRRRVLALVAPVVLIPALCIGVWSTYNYFVNDSFTPSTVGGYVLIQTVMPVIQNAPEGYDGITQTLVGYRNAQIKQTGSATGAVFRAWRDMMNETGFTFSKVSSKLTALSLYLMYHYPAVYWDSIQESWARFWDFAFFHYDPVPPGAAAFAANFADARVQNILNILFWLTAPALAAIALLQARLQRSVIPTETLLFCALLCASVWFAGVFSSLTNLGDNSRYRVTLLPLQYATITATVWMLVQWVRARRSTADPVRPQPTRAAA